MGVLLCVVVMLLLGIHICIVFYYFHILLFFPRVFRDNIYSLHGMGSFFSPDSVYTCVCVWRGRIFCVSRSSDEICGYFASFFFGILS